MVGGDSGLARKPDPAPLMACVAACGVKPEEAAYVGDSETDAHTAGFAKLPFLLFTGGYRSAPLADLAHDAAFAHFALLPPAVESLARPPAAAVLPFPGPAVKAG